MKNYFLGLDGGGTKTGFILRDFENNTVLEGGSGPSNYLHKQIFHESLKTVFQQINNYFAGFQNSEIALSVCGGFAGVAETRNADKEIAAYLHEILGSTNIILKEVKIVSDAVLVLQSYFPDKAGIILISGTGSICLGVNKEGMIFRSGGFGFMIDDMASGFYFGRAAFHLALKSKFHHGEKSIIETLVKEFFKIEDIEQIINIAHSKDGKKKIASASPLLFEAAKQGCIFSRGEIDKGIEGLAYLVENCLKQIDEESCSVILHGSVMQHQSIICDKLSFLLPNCSFLLADKRVEITAIELLQH